ncbi:uncharacterized protein LOC130818137 [Amaranthus tricolor]|uniref:uncharacterized protein LOC130818137 n=1 Tax=Amaranthus tricolor TaxID=29722 RepID=UPI0025873481|nr:uncharacterized protein LOC130818137 [Amaranthus tricolor]
MAKKKRTNKKPLASHDNIVSKDETRTEQEKDIGSSIDTELERQIAGVKALADIEVEHLLTGLRLIRSCFNKEQLQTPVLQFFKENLPNVSVVKNSEDEHFDLRWKDEDGYGGDIHASLFHQMSMAYPSYSDARQSFGGFQFSVGMPEGFQTPGAQSQRLSVGMTPKTLRVPKHGEMLLSVHGSPLGVYKEDNMEAIRESEEG